MIDIFAPERAGSPPPMRGKAARSSCGLLSRGITPAYAGKSSVDAGDAWKRRDHPRLCGEKGNSKGLRGARWGSPPPMRGKGTPFASSFSPRRITPAYAGKSFAKTIRVPQSRDHPRLCGEKCRLYAMQTAGTGSPPPMRGKELTFGRSAPRSRITPAYAGKRRRKSELPETLQDHPRLCGEKQTCYTAYSGKPGITPAYAGKSTR